MIKFSPLLFRMFRAKQRLSIGDMAELMNCTPRTIQNYEKIDQEKTAQMRLDAFLTVINEYNLPIDAFFESDKEIFLSNQKNYLEVITALTDKIKKDAEEYMECKLRLEQKIEELKREIEKLKVQKK